MEQPTSLKTWYATLTGDPDMGTRKIKLLAFNQESAMRQARSYCVGVEHVLRIFDVNMVVVWQ